MLGNVQRFGHSKGVKVLTSSGLVVLEVLIINDDDEQLEDLLEEYYYAFREEIDLEWDRIHCAVCIRRFTTQLN